MSKSGMSAGRARTNAYNTAQGFGAAPSPPPPPTDHAANAARAEGARIQGLKDDQTATRAAIQRLRDAGRTTGKAYDKLIDRSIYNNRELQRAGHATIPI